MSLHVNGGRSNLVEMERCTILNAIDDLPANGGEEKQERRLDKLLNDYNQIMEAIGRIPSLEVRDPLRILPLEVWIQVIIWSLPSAAYTSALLLLTMVSTEWRDTLISIPILWTHIHIDPFAHDCWVKIAMFLHFSRGVAISITTPVPTGHVLNTISTIIKPHASRVHELIFVEGKSRTEARNTSMESLYRMVEALGFPEGICILRIQGQSRVLVSAADTPKLLAIMKPSVRVLENIVLTASAFRLLSPNLAMLGEAFVDGNVDSILALLGGCTNLKLLKVFRTDFSSSDGGYTAAPRTADFEKLSAEVQLKEFHFHCGDHIEKSPLLVIFWNLARFCKTFLCPLDTP